MIKLLNILNESEDKEKSFFLKAIKVLLNLGVDSDYDSIISSLKNNLHMYIFVNPNKKDKNANYNKYTCYSSSYTGKNI